MLSVVFDEAFGVKTCQYVKKLSSNTNRDVFLLDVQEQVDETSPGEHTTAVGNIFCRLKKKADIDLVQASPTRLAF